jgi:hypothetical protein
MLETMAIQLQVPRYAFTQINRDSPILLLECQWIEAE